MSLLLAAAMVVTMFAACGGSNNDANANNDATNTEVVSTENNAEVEADAEYAVAMITDYGDITDQSFNQTTYEACKAFCEANGVDFKYFKPAADSTADRVASVELAIDEGYNVIVMPGYAFGGTIAEISGDYPEVKFLALDVAAGEL